METAGGTSRMAIFSIDRPQEAADRILQLSRARAAHPGEGNALGTGHSA
jgi:hypothetical protein